MAKILVFVENIEGKVKGGSLELVSAAKTSGAEVIAVSCGKNAKTVAGDLGSHGVKKLFASEHAQLMNYNSEAYAAAITGLIQSEKPDIVLASGSSLARDLFPRVAAKLGVGVVADCVELKISGTTVSAQKPMYSGKCTAEANFSGAGPKIVLMRANQLPIATPAGGTAEVVELNVPAVDLRALVKEVVKGASSKLDLTEANIIVSGGRGMKGAEHFKLLEDLANVLGATVGASRAVVDAGWVDHSMQVGQTGKTVAPSLYIACGISGAIQHLAGMSSSKVIVAINKDPEAPIFKKATYGIVGDVFDVVPKLTEEFKKLLS